MAIISPMPANILKFSSILLNTRFDKTKKHKFKKWNYQSK